MTLKLPSSNGDHFVYTFVLKTAIPVPRNKEIILFI